MAADEPTPSELDRRLTRLEANIASQIGQLREAVHTDIQQLREDYRRQSEKVVYRDTYAAHREQTSQRLDDVESNQKWYRRAIVASLIFPLIALVVGSLLVASITGTI